MVALCSTAVPIPSCKVGYAIGGDTLGSAVAVLSLRGLRIQGSFKGVSEGRSSDT
jgi:hypothetical protein